MQSAFTRRNVYVKVKDRNPLAELTEAPEANLTDSKSLFGFASPVHNSLRHPQWEFTWFSEEAIFGGIGERFTCIIN
ncbi:UNVERIFIED_CONTAM: hypothetical protein PYX00_000094 [Menopon gallinae]|uniref:Uncharacterized protein n=1 Tax=Menopon gallinae TaxID=328185 RepID=A0AAW2I7S4_9NEOP